MDTTADNNTEDAVKRVPVPGRDRGGKWITFGAEAYRVPPLGFRALQDLQGKLAALSQLQGAPSQDQMSAITEVVHMAVNRNYPAMTLDELADMLDLGNFKEVLETVLGASGFRRAEPGEARATSRSTGTDSTSS